MNRIISFTKLETVKSLDFEYTNSLFFERMKEEMEINLETTNVTYDQETDTYTIKFCGKDYDVYYGNEALHCNCKDESIIKELNKLIDYKNKQIEIINNKKKNEKKHKSIIKNGDKGIFRSEKDKIIYIKHLMKQLGELNKKNKEFSFIDKNSDISCFMDIFDKCPEIVHKYCVGRFIFFGICSIILLILIFPLGTSFPIILTLLLISTGLLIGALLNDSLDRCISIILPIFLLIRYSISRLKEKSKLKGKIDGLMKKVTTIEKSLKDPTKLLEEEIVQVNSSDKVITQEAYEIIKNMIYENRDKIVNIHDNKKKNKYGSELSEIIDFERVVLKNSKGINPQDIINQLKRLSYQIDKEISTEERIEQNNKTYDEMIDECNKVISYHR
jgi:hypothetical protein